MRAPRHLPTPTHGPPARRPARALLAAAVIAAAAVAGCSDEARVPRSGPRPNVLMIVIDTTRADHCSIDGYRRPTTPSLERLAATGVNFRDAWVPAGWTAPSHASLFTGLRPLHHGLLDGGKMLLGAEFQTLAESLKDAGWATGCFTNNAIITDSFGLTQGFDTYDALYKSTEIPYPRARGTHDRVLQFARRAHDEGKSFFAFVNDFEPHLPYVPQPESLRQIGVPVPVEPFATWALEFDNPITMRCNLGQVPLRAGMAELLPGLYDGEIAHVDDAIGRLMGQLDASGLLDSTLVVVTSDHGENLGDHALWSHRFSLHRTIRRVPLVMRLPGVLDGGREVRDPVRLEDVMPTVLEACGLAVPQGLDGASLFGDVSGRISRAAWGPQDWARANLLAEYPGSDSPMFDRTIRAVYDSRFHLIVTDGEALELYDTQSDPAETLNLAAARPDVVRRLRPLLDP